MKFIKKKNMLYLKFYEFKIFDRRKCIKIIYWAFGSPLIIDHFQVPRTLARSDVGVNRYES